MMNKNNIRRSNYLSALRFVAVAGSIFVWAVSVMFSADGFAISNPEYEWVGVGFALIATILQLIFNKGSFSNPTLFILGVLAYIYGIITNFMGIIHAGFWTDSQYQVYFVAVFAAIIEVAPETMFLWGWLNEGQPIGDFISSLLAGTQPYHSPTSGARPQNTQQRPSKPVHRTQGQSGHNGQDADTRKVIDYAMKNKVNGNFPSVRSIGDATGVSKSKVAEILKPYR
jgi:hypothetical protein